MTLPIFIYQPENINNATTNGGRMTGKLVGVGQANGAGGFPPISLAEQASGVTKTRKEFIKFADSLNRLIIRAIIFLSAPSLATDSRGYFIAGTQRDQQSAIGSRKYATGVLNADIFTGNTALVVNFELGGGADLVVQAGDTIAIMDSTHENFITVDTVIWTGDQAAITLTAAVVNDFLAAETNVAACLVVENVTTGFDNVTKSFVGSTYDETTYPVLTNNIGTDEQTIVITMLDADTFSVVSDKHGVLANGSRAADYAPLNPDFYQPYFTLSAAGWGGAGTAGETMSFQTHPAAIPVWLANETFAGAAPDADSLTLAVRIEY